MAVNVTVFPEQILSLSTLIATETVSRFTVISTESIKKQFPVVFAT